ncbi:MAG: 1-acyl-sn-glycerol-3-phosphate acyltransferase [Treponema sp.]|nr:1-acyl-sn-glycerol-3-phosphate acyltransferase [Treponema sp.]
MLRIWYAIIKAFPDALGLIRKGREAKKHPERHSVEENYNVLLHYIEVLQKKAYITTIVSGTENLPAEGSYVMFPNHQGKYDGIGLIGAHKKPCTVVIDAKRSRFPIVDEFITLIGGFRLDRTSMRSQFEGMSTIVDEIKAGRRFIVFPEGMYRKNHNNVLEFRPGAFKSAIRAKCPIVPVALVDSYKVFEYNSIKPVQSQVHFLKPLYYEDYKDLTSQQIADKVREAIVEKIVSVVS